MLGWLIIGALLTGAALSLYAFRDDIKEHLQKSGLLHKVVSLHIKKIFKQGNMKKIKFSALDNTYDTVQDMEYQVSDDIEIDDDIYEGAYISI